MAAAAGGPAPLRGSLEWLADQAPDALALHAPGCTLTRARWEQAAAHLAEALAARGAVPGTLIAAGGELSPAWHTTAWAAAKLGAGLVALPPLRAPPPGALPVRQDELVAALDAPAPPDAPRRLTGLHPPPDAVTHSAGGSQVRRTFTPVQVAAIGPALRDLVAALRLRPGRQLLAAGPAADATLRFTADVVLVGGGSVHHPASAAPADVVDLLAAGGHTALALTPADLQALAAAADPRWDELDLLDLATVVTGGATVGPELRAQVEDRFGPGLLVDVLTTADTGVVGTRTGDAAGFALLDGIGARTTAAGLLEVRSPLAARAGWVPTGDRAAVDGRTVLLDG